MNESTRQGPGSVSTAADRATTSSEGPPSNVAVLHPCPPGFVAHEFEREFEVAAPRDVVWAWIDRPEHFSEAQVFPVRIEFASPSGRSEPGFGPGDLNLHHGPCMALAGRMTEVRAGEYREMQYFYGSYVLSLRLVRPTAMAFELGGVGPGRTRVRVRFSSWVHPRAASLWTLLQRVFWWRFPASLERGVSCDHADFGSSRT